MSDETITAKQRAVLAACMECEWKSGVTPRYLHHPFIVRSLLQRGLLRDWEPKGIYHGWPKVEITDAGREAFARSPVPGSTEFLEVYEADTPTIAPMPKTLAERQADFKQAMKEAGFVRLEAYVTQEQREKFRRLGGDEWLRKKIDGAKEKAPTSPDAR